MGGAAISQASKHQAVVATSKCEAECIAAAFGTKEGSWLRSMLRELKCADMLGHATLKGVTTMVLYVCYEMGAQTLELSTFKWNIIFHVSVMRQGSCNLCLAILQTSMLVFSQSS
jgi:hypothetical protein